MYKPAGLLVHRSNIDKYENDYALQRVRDHIGKTLYPFHRIDKPTSGVLIFALNSQVAAAMSERISKKGIYKTYCAVVRGYTDDYGCIDHPLRKIIDTYGNAAVKTDEFQGAVTSFRRLAKMEIPIAVDKYETSRYSLVELNPHTGRRHQLRRHMKHISHPIIGDPKYGKSRHNNFFKSHFNSHRLLLCCVSMQFVHPIENKPVRITAHPDESFMNVAGKFDFDMGEFVRGKGGG